jgi:hypothetical protein
VPGQLIRVQVTAADIKKATRNSSMNCAVAVAIARVIPDATRIEMDTQTMRWTSGGERHIYLTPPSVIGYVIAFDAGDPIKPFGFTLNWQRRFQVKKAVTTPAGGAVAKARSAKARADKRLAAVKAAAPVTAKAPTAKAPAKAPTAKAPAPKAPKAPAGDPGAAAEYAGIVAKRAAEAEAARHQLEAVAAKHKGQPRVTVSGAGRYQAPPTVWKTKVRAYGHRVLRINQPVAP